MQMLLAIDCNLLPLMLQFGQYRFRPDPDLFHNTATLLHVLEVGPDVKNECTWTDNFRTRWKIITTNAQRRCNSPSLSVGPGRQRQDAGSLFEEMGPRGPPFLFIVILTGMIL